jgi:hypothetical protein
MIRLRFCTLEYTPEGAVTRFPDGSSYGALPHDKPHYHAVAHRLGYAGNILAYCQHHELAHHLIAEAFGSHSPVIWALAHGEEPPRMIAAAEEALAMTLQRYAMTNELPMIEGIEWDELKCRMLLAETRGTDARCLRDEGDLLCA